MSFFNIFATSAYANDLDAMDYVDCALEAVGADVLFSFMTSGAKTWTVATIKRAFPVIAKRALGPIGAAVAAVTFGYCVYKKYRDANDCTYSVPIPSDIERSFISIAKFQKTEDIIRSK